MATTGKVKGLIYHLFIEDGGTLTKVGNARSRSVTINSATIDVTNADSNEFQELLPSTKSLEASVDGVFTFDTTNVAPNDLVTSILAGTKLVCRAGTNVTGDAVLNFEAYLSSVEITSSYDDVVQFSASLSSTGNITQVVLT